MEAFFLNFINQKPFKRKFILLILDILILLISIIIVSFFTVNTYSYSILLSNKFFLILLLSTLGVYYLGGQYKALTRFSNIRTFYLITFRNFIVFLLLSTFKIFAFKELPEYKYIALLIFVISFFSFSYRLILSDF